MCYIIYVIYVYRVSNPEQVVYGEHIIEEGDMKSGEDIGSLIIHTYEVRVNSNQI